MAAITYKRTYAHQDWIDNADIVQAGGDRGFNIEFHGLEAEFDNIGGVVAQLNAGLGAFQPVGAGGAVAYAGGNVGIGASYSAVNLPAYRLAVDLAPNTATSEQVRFGHAVCSNGGAGTFAAYAVFSHDTQASDSSCGFRQGPNGNVHINAPTGQPISIRQTGTSVRLGITASGNVVVGSETDLAIAPPTATLQVVGDAFKNTGSASWLVPSDARLKEDVRDLDAGLAQLLQVRPVRFRYNGRAGTPAGQEGVGVLGQEIEKVFPEMIRRVPGGLHGVPDTEDMRIYDGSALTFVLVNAVKELAEKVERLERTLAESSNSRNTRELS
jgi:hypothetical protein